MNDHGMKKRKPKHKIRTYLIAEVNHHSTADRPAHKLVINALSRGKAREHAALEDPERPALWLDPERSRCELLPNRRAGCVLKNF